MTKSIFTRRIVEDVVNQKLDEIDENKNNPVFFYVAGFFVTCLDDSENYRSSDNHSWFLVSDNSDDVLASYCNISEIIDKLVEIAFSF